MNGAKKRKKVIQPTIPMGTVADSLIRIGIVKKNTDYQTMGRLMVWIPEMGGDPTLEQNWIIVGYCSPFAGATNPKDRVHNATDMAGSQSSYGFWMVPPDLENQVAVFFANGDLNKGYWFGCMYQQNMNHMVPGLAQGTPTVNVETGGVLPPVVEYNKWSDQNPDSPARPVFTPLHEGLSAQGLYKDTERGPSTASARREAPSKVFGYNTPRGNSLYIDDNPENEFIRMRTRSGAQIMVHETTGYVYINSKNGNSWAEISDKGIDMYTRGTMSARSQGAMNFHSDASINIEADGNMNFRAGGNLTFQTPNHTYFAGSGHLVLEYGGNISGKASGDIVLGASGGLQLGASGDIGIGASGQIVHAASKIVNNGGIDVAVSPASAVLSETHQLPDVRGSGPSYQSDTRETIVTRLPTHEPFGGHPSTGDSSTDPVSSSEYVSSSDRNETLQYGDNIVSSESGSPQADPSFTDDDLNWLTICVYSESAGEPDDGRAAVARMILNRTANNFRENNLSPTFTGVKKWVLANHAFSYFWSSNGKTISVKKNDWAAAEQRGIELYNKNKNNTTFKKINDICKQVMANTYSGADVYKAINANRSSSFWFYNPNTSSPSWASSLRIIGTIGGHRFLMRK